MENKINNSINKLIAEINNTVVKTEKLNNQTEIDENEIKEKIINFKKRFKKLGEQLQSETLIKYIHEDEELNKLVYKVYIILRDVKYKK